MKRLVLLMVILTLVCAPLAQAKKRARSADSTPAATATSLGGSAPAQPPASGAGSGSPAADAPSGDVTQVLDDVLAKPVDSLVRGKPQADDILQGKAELNSAGIDGSGGDDQAVPGLKALTPKAAPQVLKGNASIGSMRGLVDQNDPDAGDEELAIAWDRWRNRFLRAVQLQVQASVNNPDDDDFGRRRFDRFTGMPLPRFPLGTEAWFDCEVGADRRVIRVAITQPSGFAAYDRAVLEGIRALEGTSLLTFPRGSRRQSVRQEAGIRTATSSNFQYYNFGDVERFNVPRGGGY